MQSVLASQLPPNTVLALNWRALLFAAAAVTCVLRAARPGSSPALQASRPTRRAAEGRAAADAGTRPRFRETLDRRRGRAVGRAARRSGLLLASFLRLQRTRSASTRRACAAAFVGLPAGALRGARATGRSSSTEVDRQLRAQPAIDDAAAALGLPLGRLGRERRTASRVSRRRHPGSGPLAGINIVSDGYFAALAIRNRAGPRTYAPTIAWARRRVRHQ